MEINPKSFSPHEAASQEELDVREILLKLIKRRWLIVMIVLVSVTLTAIYSVMQTPVYKANTRILVETQRPRITKVDEIEQPRYVDETSYMNSQVEVLKSTMIANLVYEDVGYEPFNALKRKKTVDTESLTKEERVKLLLKQVSVKLMPRSNLIDISVEDSDPQRAARIANAWVFAYLSYPLVSQAYLTQHASGSLEKAVEKARERLKKAESDVNEYRRSHNIVDTSSGQTESIAIMDELIKRKAELEAQLAQDSNYYKEKHPVIIGLKAELQSIVEKISRESTLHEKEVQYEILKREVETSRAFYESLLSRLRHDESVEGLKVSNVKIVDDAKAPKYPYKPNKRLNVLLALCLGLCAGAGAALMLEGLDQSIKIPDDIQKVLGIPFLVLVPRYKTRHEKGYVELFSNREKNDPVTEAYRSLRTNITFSNPDVKKKTLIVTSSIPSEGKTTVATNLAIVFAQTGEKTVLLDADLRHPKMHNFFSVPRHQGITEQLAQGGHLIPSCIHHTEVPNLDLIVSGTIPPNPAELLSSQSMETFLSELANTYDRIVIDTPPVLAVTDAVILASKVDAVVFVVRSENTYRKAARRAIDLLRSVDANLLGAVLNMVEIEKHGGYYYYHYYHYHYQYGYPHRKRKSAALEGQRVKIDTHES